ncbi:MAG: hypothetical protein VKK59_02140, partial [Vampirovibrionales bacterium]|nr:hypothetical protein [Vampirovibrionales bacterium]
TKNPGWRTPLDGISAAWQTQGNRALLPLEPISGRGQTPIIVHVQPGAGVTSLDVTAWFYVDILDSWVTFTKKAPVVTLTQASLLFIENPSGLPCYLQVSNLVGGTSVSLYVDGQTAGVG